MLALCGGDAPVITLVYPVQNSDSPPADAALATPICHSVFLCRIAAGLTGSIDISNTKALFLGLYCCSAAVSVRCSPLFVMALQIRYQPFHRQTLLKEYQRLDKTDL